MYVYVYTHAYTRMYLSHAAGMMRYAYIYVNRQLVI